MRRPKVYIERISECPLHKLIYKRYTYPTFAVFLAAIVYIFLLPKNVPVSITDDGNNQEVIVEETIELEEEVVVVEEKEMPTIDEWMSIQFNKHGANETLMRAIMACESMMYQIDPDSGETIRNHNYRTNDEGVRYLHSTDWGLFQINDRAWNSRAEELGLDYKNDAYDNVLMAMVVYEEQGLTAWVAYNNGCYRRHM